MDGWMDGWMRGVISFPFTLFTLLSQFIHRHDIWSVGTPDLDQAKHSSAFISLSLTLHIMYTPEEPKIKKFPKLHITSNVTFF
jgi:hypothetical protein